MGAGIKLDSYTGDGVLHGHSKDVRLSVWALKKKNGKKDVSITD